jgi:hypothetical protein
MKADAIHAAAHARAGGKAQAGRPVSHGGDTLLERLPRQGNRQSCADQQVQE